MEHRIDHEACVFKIGSGITPALEIASGDTVTAKCKDGWNGAMEGTESIGKLNLDEVLPATGPIFVREAEPGDALEIYMEDLRPGSVGIPAIVPGVGFLKEYTKPFARVLKVEDGFVEFSENVRIPIKPHLGFLAVAPAEGEEMSNLVPGPHGGNMDCREVTIGASVYLPVFVPGAFLFLGDGHAVQGDGEVCVSAAECDMEARFTVKVVKNAGINCPRIENKDTYFTIGAAEKIDDALAEALREMIGFLRTRKGFSAEEAYMLCSLAVDMRINQLVNGLVSARAALPKAIFSERLGLA